MNTSFFNSSLRIFALLSGAVLMGTLPACAQQSSPALPVTGALQPELTSNNAAWLGHAFVTTDSVIATVPQTAAFMRDHKVNYWFVNLGIHDKAGRFSRGAAAVPRIKEFLTAVHNWEIANKYQFKVLGWLNGTMDESSARYIDMSQQPIRQAMLDECRRFINPDVDGSYVAGAPRMLDGIQYDLEPSGADEARFANLLTFMKDLRAAVGSQKLTSFTPHKLDTSGNKGRYWWSAEFFYRMAPLVDLLGVMTYDTGIKDEAKYRDWMKQQTTGVLQAVSGATWKNDDAHPVPPKVAKIFIGFPAFPVNNWHDLAGETMPGAIAGTQDGIKELEAAKDPSLRYFGGAGVYLYTDGSGKDNYSSPQHWSDFRTQWLNQP